MIKAIIFDYDGVIVDSFVSVFEIYKKTCKRFKVEYPKTIEEFRVVYGYNFVECYKNLGIQESDFPEAIQIFREDIVKFEHSIFAGISDVIKELNKKYKLYIVSASGSEEILPKMEKFGLTSLFKKIYCGTNEGLRKSAMITELLNENNYSVGEVISIGDRAIDYDVAKKVGIEDDNIILVTYGWGLDKDKIGKAKIADTPHEILSLINLV